MAVKPSLWLVFIAAFLFHGCDRQAPRVEGGQALGGVSAEMTSVIAEQCAPKCRFLTVEFEVNNRGGALLCLPAVYNSSFLYFAMYLKYKENNEQIFASRAMDPNEFWSINPVESIPLISKSPVYVIAPGSSKKIKVIFQEPSAPPVFDLVKAPASAVLRLATFSCEHQGDYLKGMKYVDLEHDIDFTGGAAL